LIASPVYFSRKKKKSKKRRYTKGHEAVPEAGPRRVARRIPTANSFSEGFDTFAKRSKRSARRRRDGLVRDSLRNAARGFSDAAREVGKAPWPIAGRSARRTCGEASA